MTHLIAADIKSFVCQPTLYEKYALFRATLSSIDPRFNHKRFLKVYFSSIHHQALTLKNHSVQRTGSKILSYIVILNYSKNIKPNNVLKNTPILQLLVHNNKKTIQSRYLLSLKFEPKTFEPLVYHLNSFLTV